MLMMRRANMGLSIAAEERIGKPRKRRHPMVSSFGKAAGAAASWLRARA